MTASGPGLAGAERRPHRAFSHVQPFAGRCALECDRQPRPAPVGPAFQAVRAALAAHRASAAALQPLAPGQPSARCAFGAPGVRVLVSRAHVAAVLHGATQTRH